MNRNKEVEQIQKAFIDALKAIGTTFTLEEFESLANDPQFRDIIRYWRSRNRKIIGVKGVGFVNYHIRSEESGFWGICPSIESDFKTLTERLSIPCWHVLLVRRNEKWIDGYILDHSLKAPLTKTLKLQKDKKYKINEKSDLDQSACIHSIDKVAEKLIEKGKSVKAA